MKRQSKITYETIQKASKFCATNGFILQNNHQARKTTLIQIEYYWMNLFIIYFYFIQIFYLFT